MSSRVGMWQNWGVNDYISWLNHFFLSKIEYVHMWWELGEQAKYHKYVDIRKDQAISGELSCYTIIKQMQRFNLCVSQIALSFSSRPPRLTYCFAASVGDLSSCDFNQHSVFATKGNSKK